MYEAGSIVALAGGHYRLREPLGGSAYGVVWRADAPGLGAGVALKLVNTGQMERAPEGLRARWIACASTEIAFLRGLAPWDGRHLVRLVDAGEHQGMPALALELLDGDLASHLAAEQDAGRSVPVPQVLAWIGQVNQALAKVHAYGWRHLDLKPGNLLLDRGANSVKLADFGTTRRLDDLRAHSYAGTANWQAPEQFFPEAGGYQTGAACDYFALGALLYYLVCGRLLRYSAACGQAWQAHGRDAAALLAARGRPAVLAADEAALFAGRAAPALGLLRKLLAERPSDRPRHALEISRLLADAAAAMRHPAMRSAA